MIFADKCYTYNLTERKQARIRKRIRRHKPVRNLYVIVLPLLQDGLLEIYPYNQLLQKPYRKLDSRIRVVGKRQRSGRTARIADHTGYV